MEIKINIPKNDYVQPTEVRQEVVQDICNYIIRFFERDDVAGVTVFNTHFLPSFPNRSGGFLFY